MEGDATTKLSSLSPPKAGAGDLAHATARGIIGAVPVAGSALAEYFSFVVGPPLEKRRNEWMAEVGERIQTLERERGVRVEDLRNNAAFVDVVMQATHVAMRSSQAEKREALGNAVFNAGLPVAPDQALQQMFLHLVDTFNEWHLRLLRLFDDPRAWFLHHGKAAPSFLMGGLKHVVESAYPDLAGRREFYDQVWRALYAAGLVNTEGLHVTMSVDGALQQRTTPLGRSFLAFISVPA